jgi:hypothetical protein
LSLWLGDEAQWQPARRGGFVVASGGWQGAGSPARRRGNFLLRRQKKVTKEEALNRKPSRRREARRAKTSTFIPGRREPLRSRCCPYDESQGSNLHAG